MLLGMAKKKPEADEPDFMTSAATPPAEMPPVPPPEAAPVLTDSEVSAEIPVFEPPPWKPSAIPIPPPWVISAQRLAWKVDALPSGAARDEAPRARWTGGDIDYCYFKGGTVIATFREGGFGRLETAPATEFDVDPEPAPEVVT